MRRLLAHHRAQSEAPLRILCIDGGGIKGVVPSIILEAIEDLCAPHAIHELFDLVRPANLPPNGHSSRRLEEFSSSFAKLLVGLLLLVILLPRA